MIVKLQQRFIPVFEELAKSINAQCLVYEEKSSIEMAMEEIENGDCEVFEDFEAYQKAMANVRL